MYQDQNKRKQNFRWFRRISEYLQVTSRRLKNHDFPMFSICLGVRSFFLRINKIASYFISKNLNKPLAARTAGGHHQNNLTNGITFKDVTNGIIVSSCCHAGHRVLNSNVILAFAVRTILNLSKRNLFIDTKKLKQVSLRLLLGIGLSQLGVGCWTLSTVLCLSGCMGVYEGGFECFPERGVGCKSISEVNKMVNQCSVPSIQCSECKTMDIWYSPWFYNSQKNFSRNLDFQDTETARLGEKVDVSGSI